MKTAIVTGVSRGIGAAITSYLLECNWRVIGLSRTDPGLESIDNFEHITVDLADLPAVKAVAAQLSKCDAIDAVICAAGVGRFQGAEGFSIAQIEHLLRVNFSANAVLLGELLPKLKKQRHGRIVVVGSEAALQGARLGSIYCATKFALRGYCQSLRMECRGAGVSVTMIQPGLTRTGFYDELHFNPGSLDHQALEVADVSTCVAQILSLPAHAVVEELVLQPLQPCVEKK